MKILNLYERTDNIFLWKSKSFVLLHVMKRLVVVIMTEVNVIWSGDENEEKEKQVWQCIHRNSKKGISKERPLECCLP